MAETLSVPENRLRLALYIYRILSRRCGHSTVVVERQNRAVLRLSYDKLYHATGTAGVPGVIGEASAESPLPPNQYMVFTQCSGLLVVLQLQIPITSRKFVTTCGKDYIDLGPWM